MSYADQNVFIVKIRNGEYVAYLQNIDCSRIKMLNNGSVVDYSNRYAYLYDQYGIIRPVWEKSIHSIRYEFESKIGSAPSANPEDYSSDNDYFTFNWQESLAEKKRMKSAWKEYNAKKAKYPSFRNMLNVDDDEIDAVIDYFISIDDSSSDSSGGGYDYSSLDF